MIGAAALVGALAARIATLAAGLAAGAILAVLPTSIRYAQEAQPYALAVFAAVLATWLLVPALDRPAPRRLVPYAGAVLLLGLCQPVALLLLAGHGWTVLAFRRRVAVRWLAAVLLGCSRSPRCSPPACATAVIWRPACDPAPPCWRPRPATCSASPRSAACWPGWPCSASRCGTPPRSAPPGRWCRRSECWRWRRPCRSGRR
ncbi:hypothetical protein V2I01_34435 [Micromonospora sp. BRA006-A]|nr:hypothetical protein [Micromonospora sp. BRA006-A]